MGKNKKRLFWAAILLLLFLPPCYYLKSSFVGRKAQLERERLLVRKQISKPLQPGEGEEEGIGPDLWEEELMQLFPEIPREEADIAEIMAPPEEKRVSEPTEIPTPQIPKGEERKGEAPKRIVAKKREPVTIVKKEIVQKERKPLVQRTPVGEKERVEPEVKEKRVVPPMRVAALAECEGVPISHRNLALFLCKGLHLGSNLSYDQAVMVLNGIGISPTAGWSLGDPWFPIGADELEEMLSRVERAISVGLVEGGYAELTGGLRHYCKREKAQLVETPQCEGPMVTECVRVEIPQCDFAIYLCKVLGIGEDLNCNQSFLALAALGISPRGGWRVDEPYVLIAQRDIEDIRCSVREAYEKGLIRMDQTIMVASANDYCLWLKMNVEVVGEGTVAETVGLSDYQGGGGVSMPVASASQ